MKGGRSVTVALSIVLLMLIAVFGITAARQATRIYSQLSTSDRVIQSIEQELAGIRSDIFLSGIYVRNQLLNSRSPWSEDQRGSLRTVRDSVERRLKSISSVLADNQRSRLQELRQAIEHYWTIVFNIVDDPETAAAHGPTVRAQLRIRRDAAIGVTEQLSQINKAADRESHSQIERAQTAFMNYIFMMMGITLGLGGIASVTSGYLVGVLNRRAEAHRKRIELTETELRLLSANLFHSQEQERKLLSRELHDEVGQTLTALGMELGNVQRLYEHSKEEFLQHVGEARRLTLETLKTVRRMAMGLRPAMLDDSGLAPAVRYQVREFSRHSGIPATIEIEGSFDHLPESYRTCVYRVIQEALTNCARHSQARTVRILLTGNPANVSVSIEDDGVGFAEARPSGLGLIGIGERTRELNGRVDITSEFNRGTVLRVDLPLPQNSPA